ncbi:MAG TPA: imidazole glycerol phosphate synthase subunit HisH [Sulfurovum sp.]|nr:MAG: imidazole glycerol phosphate synthase subunit HisH [Sulfurovum sp. 35-42-20]OYZ25064.1 MAG: imidazole glycerol phosphate synthase subunit HisH [Sulfurovum sp. 16-42-52]OYZ48972.1 MAG: imidazole glycerol phosphate synthase subunit HisH [Sulfurovum sp. 24-42-9]OZA44831.1 MAG: imidazole glycerol phosphate synthase subunit HisH [Sulfurovum sp. 17-42-90]OZA61112.1 MAG: imidazole glycerol phosphate synthase subunit HisH [Sulfurovum sp. 39-42-12]HQR73603.1 imidazole glycerol phosphate synthas
MIGIVDYKMGNLASVINAFVKVGAVATLESDPSKLNQYDKLILPGVGAFGDAMTHLKENGMDEAVKNFATTGKPLLGICLGMQLLFESSEEFGATQGLGLIPGKVVAFDENRFDHTLKVPHMGWNELFVQKETPIFEGLPKEFYLYFVHSYHAVCDDAYAIGKTHYGYEFVSAVQNGNIYGIQPHPEKSHNNGLKIIENFVKL